MEFISYQCNICYQSHVSAIVLKVESTLVISKSKGPEGRFSPKKIYQGDRRLDFAEIKSLYVHLSDINE